MDPKLRKIILAFTGGALLILAIVFIYRFFTTGYIDITTDRAGYTITIQRTAPTVTTETVQLSGTHYKGSYSTGDYSVRINDSNASSGLAAKTFKLSFAKTQKLNFYTSKTDFNVSNFMPVTSLGTTGLTYQNNLLRFMNVNSHLYGNLISIDRNNHVTNIEATGSYPSYFKDASWNINGQGIVIGGDGLYKLNSNELKPQKVKNTPVASNKIVRTAIGPNGDIYISDGKNIYRLPAGQSDFKKILSNDLSASVLSASNDHVIMLTGTEQSRILKVVLMDLRTGEQKSISGDIYTALFSPDGKHIIINGNGKITGIYSTDTFKIVNVTPRKDSSVLAWYDNDNIVYSDSKSLWRYNLEKSESYIIANLANSEAVVNKITVTNDKNTIFVNTTLSTSSDDYFKTYKYDTNNPTPKISSTLSVLNMMFPYSEQNCYFDYVALNPNAKINIVTTGTKSKISVCKIILKNYLNRYSIDQSKLTFQDIVTTQPSIQR